MALNTFTTLGNHHDYHFPELIQARQEFWTYETTAPQFSLPTVPSNYSSPICLNELVYFYTSCKVGFYNIWPVVSDFFHLAQYFQYSSMYQNFIVFKGCIIPHFVYTPHFVYPFICWCISFFLPTTLLLWIMLLWTYTSIHIIIYFHKPIFIFCCVNKLLEHFTI